MPTELLQHEDAGTPLEPTGRGLKRATGCVRGPDPRRALGVFDDDEEEEDFDFFDDDEEDDEEDDFFDDEDEELESDEDFDDEDEEDL